MEKVVDAIHAIFRMNEGTLQALTSWFSQEGDLTYSTNSFYGHTAGYKWMLG